MATNRSDASAAVEALSSLDDPLRRTLYEYVVDADGPVSREDAAAVAEIGRTLAAYHLDKLAEAGLLAVGYQRPPGRSGPGAGRPAKVYAPADREVSVSVPPRDYEFLARLIVEAIEHDEGVRAAVNDSAFDAGRRAGAAAAGDVFAALKSCGYRPAVGDDGSIALRNCPFHAVARDHTEVVCGLNLRLIEGIVAGCDDPGARPRLDPHPDRCCVVVTTSARA
ncbi:helix-turn-helix transcriptional regulator [Mycolicibacterium thermoresistibile]